MSEVLKTELVNFRNLNHGGDTSRSAELARHVATLFAYTSDRCSDEQVDIYDSVLLRLVGMVETEVRHFVAEKMAGLRRGPEETIRRLAEDDIEIAEPILRRSTVLRDADLVRIAGGKSDTHRLAISKREVLSEEVTEVLVVCGDLMVKRQVARNPGAVFSDASMANLIDYAASDATIQISLSEREDLAEHHIKQLVTLASEEVRKVLMARGRKADADRLPEAAELAAQRLTNEYWLGRYDFETARNRVLRLAKRGMINEMALRRYVTEDRFAEAVAAFAWMAHCGVEEVSHWMVREDPEPFLVMAKAAGLSSITISGLLSIGAWRVRLSAKARFHAIETFNMMTVAEAERRMAHWNHVVLN
ncbi:DUF2336 domain-containing protein [Roseibium algae]|uniref:DUF2336 domain-containing protein n=1 Tax=Roseibium algae TaxID=3123038 RepID=A0ABU8TKF3_9HYPH